MLVTVKKLALPMLASALFATRCISPESPLIEAGGECAAFTPGQGVGSDTEIDATVHLFMEASSDFTKVAEEMKGRVKTACANIATDLGATNTWGNLGDNDTSIANEDGTGACNQAGEKIAAIMENDRSNFALVVTRGACHVDFAGQQSCDAGCNRDQACEPGAIEQRCEPGELSVFCETNCLAQAWCEGTAANACNCEGDCEATCVGQCDGACIAADGSVTMDDPNCRGRCASSCHGTCEGACQIQAEEGINCGTNVRCKGGCESSYSDPVCETVIGPPDCAENQQCHESCAAKAAANPVCEPTHVELFTSSTDPDVQKLVGTINANLGPLVEIAETKGPILVKAIDKLAITGEAVVDKAGDLSGKSLACAKVSSKAASDSAKTIKVSAQASAMVTTMTNQHSVAE